MKTHLLLSLVLATAGFGAVAAVSSESVSPPAAPAAHQPAGRAQRHLWHRAKEKLGLTEEQATRIKAELQAEKPAIAAAARRLKAARDAFREVAQRPDAREAELRAAAADLGTATADLAVIRARVQSRIQPILTPEQREQLKAMRDGLHKRIKHARAARAGRWHE